ncbi:TPA: hypothetical protein IOH10_004302 [Salmonella enterica]|nr:hypothetical protein [Salmonella enterica]HAO3760586.1 hypothetical protein [Salmonella enterica]
MKTPAFTVTGVMACLMLLSQPVNAQTEAGATFNLHTYFVEATCNALTSSGDADSAGNVDFGVISPLADGGSVEKTKHVVLTLSCGGTGLPYVAGIGFNVTNGAIISTTTTGRLYPKTPEGGEQDNLSYDWAWGKGIDEAVAATETPGYTGLKPGDKVDLSQQTNSKRYSLVQSMGKVTWDFPVDITRNVKDIATLSAGDYIAAVQVNISYD